MYNVIKEECVGHVQRCLGAGFQRYKNQNRGNVLSDGGRVGGPGRLTDNAIDKMETNFGFAIRKNVGEKQKIYDAVWDIFHHSIKKTQTKH